MKKRLVFVLFVLSAGTAFAQRVSSIAVFPFEAPEGGFTPAELAAVTGQVLAELRSWGTLTIVEGGSADYQVRGQLSKTDKGVALSAITVDGKTERTLNSSREQAADLNALGGRIFSFCAQVVEQVPFPNYLLGKWRSVITLEDGILTCLVEFKSDRTVIFEQFDSYEHRNGSALKYQGFGRGSYAYTGHVRRTLALKDAKGVVYREAPIDGSVSFTVSLEDTLPKFTAINQNRISLFFNEDKSSFELVSAGLVCGDNYDGPRIYPQSVIAYRDFTKIQ
ncbi:MAG: hypothetical protein LBD78_04700 [Spirochaetaceae bacterium]|jgi:hypothetical protein|nr:hypothetical protein [Spirochaetaceae bacterium]